MYNLPGNARRLGATVRSGGVDAPARTQDHPRNVDDREMTIMRAMCELEILEEPQSAIVLP